MLANYATNPENLRGRLHKETFDAEQHPFQRDRNRLIHSAAFRRLEYKTQVFVNYVGDHYRTRLTHSLEVAQVAKTIGRELGLNLDLVEIISLAHDAGHPPFGHQGEDALNAIANDYGGFNHNTQTIRILHYLEQRYADFDGLNLTWETLSGIAKHNGSMSKEEIKDFETRVFSDTTYWDLELDKSPSLEAQVASLADDIAYCNHDIDDGLRAGMFTYNDLKMINKFADIIEEVEVKYPNITSSRKNNEIIRRVMKYMVDDIVAQSKKNIENMNINTLEDVYNSKNFVISFSEEVKQFKTDLKRFLYQYLYRNFKVNRMSIKAKKVIQDLFLTLMQSPDCLPREWAYKVEGKDNEVMAQIIIDYISGMTDRYALEEHRKITYPYSDIHNF